ncbi:MAG: FadR/GntR family transcriptional regulator [Ignavibacteriales bacterium]
MQIKPIRKRSLPEEVANQIQVLIRNGYFKVKDQLPGERELADSLNINRSTVREALRILEVMRVIEIRQGEGAFVNACESSSIESIVFEFLYEDGLDVESLIDVFEAVVTVESSMTRLAALRVTEEETAELLAHLDKKVDKDFAVWDREFHLLISKIAKSSLLYRVDNTVWIIMEKYAGLLFDKPDSFAQACKDHRRLVEHIINHNTNEASQLMQDHLMWARKVVFPYSKMDY